MPHAAAAKAGYYVTEPSHLELIHLQGSHDYRIQVISFDRRQLLVSANQFHGTAVQSATYTIPPQTLKQNRVQASLGKLGHISVQFRPNGPPQVQREPGVHCKGRNSTQQTGRFVGTIRFHGEQGFTTARATSAMGEIFQSFRQVCKRPRESKGARTELKAVSLSAYQRESPDKASFNAYEVASGSTGPGSATYSAQITERRGRIVITRSGMAFAEPSTFAFSAPTTNPTTASVAPPFPFTGTASFERGAGEAPVWSGNLEVELPGLGTVPLTGSSFAARLCRDLSCSCPPGKPCLIGFTSLGRAALRNPLRHQLNGGRSLSSSSHETENAIGLNQGHVRSG